MKRLLLLLLASSALASPALAQMDGPPRSSNQTRSNGAFLPSVSVNGPFYARSYGVLCDGATDDTSAFAAAVAAMPANGGTLIIQSGVCIVSNITLSKSIIFQGQGGTFSNVPGATEIRGNSVSAPVITITAAFGQLNDLAVTSSVAAASRTGPGILDSGGVNTISNVGVIGHQYGIHITGAGVVLNSVVQSFAQLDGIWLDGNSTNTGATGPVLNYVQANANVLGSGIVVSGNSGGFGAGAQMFFASGTLNGASGFVLSGAVNDIYLAQSGGGSNTGIGIDANTMTGGNLAIVNSLCEQNSGGACIRIGSSTTSVSIVNNTITGSTNGIVSAGQGVSITGNTFSSNGTSAVELLTGSAHTVLSGNVLTGTNTNGIFFSGAPGAILCAATDFTVATNPRFGALPAGSSVSSCPGF